MKVVEKNKRQSLQTVLTSKMLQLTLRTDALFEHFKQSTNKQVKHVSQKVALHRPDSLTKAMDGLFKYIGNRA